MANANILSTRTPPESFVATLRLGGQDYPFRLFARPLRLGEYGTAHYYWMDSSQFRNPRTPASGANFRSVVGYWAAAMREIGLSHDVDQQVHYVFARCYCLLGRCKGMQSVYRDAYLAPDLVRVDSTSLPADIRQRIREVIQSRDGFQVRQELDAILGRFEPPEKVKPLLQEACRCWLGKGVSLLRRHGNEGLELFLKELDYWLARYRKRSGSWVRHFINMFAFECKAAFYTCYANAWVGLIPWLRVNRGLDRLSERFLRFWHNQNQPIEIPHGQTPGGVLYPTRQSVLVAEADGKGSLTSHQLTLRTEHIGPAHLRDVFSGHVLSLHPLSGYFMKDAALCAIAGRFFGSPAHDLAIGRGLATLCGAYWDLVGAILSAAHLYRQALDRQSASRGIYQRTSSEEAAGGDSVGVGEAMLLEEFARSYNIVCPVCSGGLQLRRYQPAGPDEQAFTAEFACRSCGRDVSRTIERAKLEGWLLAKA